MLASSLKKAEATSGVTVTHFMPGWTILDALAAPAALGRGGGAGASGAGGAVRAGGDRTSSELDESDSLSISSINTC